MMEDGKRRNQKVSNYDPGIKYPGIGIEGREREVCAVLGSIEGFGMREFEKVRKYFSGFNGVVDASIKQLKEAKLSGVIIEKVKLRFEKGVNGYLELLKEKGIRVVIIGDNDYPKLLAETSEAPFLMYVRGNWLPEDEPVVAVVGSRRPTNYGREVVNYLVGGLASQGVIIVSGLAYGVDALAHKVALDVNGRTIGVLGNGIDVIQPRSNQKLAEMMMENGAVMSEYAPGVVAKKQYFPARNRIVSGMSIGVLVVEGAEGSGTLITAGFAIKQKKKLFAVPGSIFNSMSWVPNQLIKQGAELVLTVDEIMNQINISKSNWGSVIKPKTKKLTKNDFRELVEWRVYETLLSEAKHIDTIVKEVKMSISEVSVILMLLEMRGVIREVDNKRFDLV